MKLTLVSVSFFLLSSITFANPVLQDRDSQSPNLSAPLNERNVSPVPLSNLIAEPAPSREPVKSKKNPESSAVKKSGKVSHFPRATATAKQPRGITITPTTSPDVPKATATLEARAPEPKKSKKESSPAAGHHSSSKKPKKSTKTPGIVGTLPSATRAAGKVSGVSEPGAPGGADSTAALDPPATTAAKASKRAAEPEANPAKSKKPTASTAVSVKKSAVNSGAGDPTPKQTASKAPKVTARNALPNAEAAPEVGDYEAAVIPEKPKYRLELSSALPGNPAPSPSAPAQKREAKPDPIVGPYDFFIPKHKTTLYKVAASVTDALLTRSENIVPLTAPTESAPVKREAEPFKGGPGREGDHNLPHGDASAVPAGPGPTATGA